MPTSFYFQSGIPMGRRSESELMEGLIIECLKIYGFDVFYLPRTAVKKDEIFGEDPLSKFTNAYPIEMYLENVDGFGGDGEFLSKFGLEIRDSATFVVSRRRWQDLIGKDGQSILTTRPAEGDLLYFPLTKSFFEIKFVEARDPFFQVGKLYVYKLQCELFQFASETIETGIKEIDDEIKDDTLDLLSYEFLLEDGTRFALEDYTPSALILENYIVTARDPGASNEDFDTDIRDILDFTDRNPFGEVFNA